MLTNLQIRNIMRRRSTTNRYITDSNVSWREELHARIDNLEPLISNACEDRIIENISDNIWGFPVNEYSTANTIDVLTRFTTDYFNFVKGRRVWVYTETEGYWTEDKIVATIADAYIMALWDIGKQMMIANYPLVAKDFLLRSSRSYIDDSKQSYHDNNSHLSADSKLFSQHDNKQDKTIENTDHTGSTTNNERSTHNERETVDFFQSPQDQGSFANQGSGTHPGFQSPDNMGESNLVLNDPLSKFATTKNNHFDDYTDTAASGQTATDKNSHNRANEMEYNDVETTIESGEQSDNNVGAKMGVDTGKSAEDTLDMGKVISTFLDSFKCRLVIEIDNRMLPYFLNMGISRFTDHRHGRKEYI